MTWSVSVIRKIRLKHKLTSPVNTEKESRKVSGVPYIPKGLHLHHPRTSLHPENCPARWLNSLLLLLDVHPTHVCDCRQTSMENDFRNVSFVVRKHNMAKHEGTSETVAFPKTRGNVVNNYTGYFFWGGGEGVTGQRK